MTNQTCPNCGYCPHCGRSAQPYQPTWVPYTPTYPTWWQQPYVTVTSGSTLTVGDIQPVPQSSNAS